MGALEEISKISQNSRGRERVKLQPEIAIKKAKITITR